MGFSSHDTRPNIMLITTGHRQKGHRQRYACCDCFAFLLGGGYQGGYSDFSRSSLPRDSLLCILYHCSANRGVGTAMGLYGVFPPFFVLLQLEDRLHCRSVVTSSAFNFGLCFFHISRRCVCLMLIPGVQGGY